jgi:hypothetical protein
MHEDFDGGGGDIDMALDDVGLDTDVTDASFDVDAVMDACDDDFSRFESPAESADVVAQPSADVIPDFPPVNADEAVETPPDAIDTTDAEPMQQSEITDAQEGTPERAYDDFEQNFLSERPDFQETYEAGNFYEQGVNEFGYQGTCGPTSEANALNKVLGTNEFTENKILSVALENNLCNAEGSLDVCGATTTEQLMELYDTVNEQIGDKVQTELFENEQALSVEEAAERINDGAVLNVAVDADALWGNPREYTDAAGGYNPDFYSDHWITVTGCQRDETGNIQGFDVTDSGGGVKYVSAEQYQEMCFGTEEHRVLDPTCIVVSKKDVANDAPAR